MSATALAASGLRVARLEFAYVGGRVASIVADDLFTEGRSSGLLCLGYPFHRPGSRRSIWKA